MKKLLYLLAMMTMFITACEKGTGADKQSDNYLTFINNTNTTPTIVAGGGIVNIAFSTELDWQITTDADWLTISATQGVGGTVEFFITASANKTDKERKGTVTITLSNGRSYKVVVTQEPNEGIRHLVCQANEILYTTKYNYVIEKDFAGMTGFGDTDATYCVDYGYDGTYGYIRFNNDVTKIPDDAFAGCASVEAIYLPDGVKEIGMGAFAGCSTLRYIVSDNSTDDFRAIIIDGCLCAFAPADLTSYTIPNNVTSLRGGVFKSCKDLEEIIIPGSIKTIESNAFADCENLKNITINEGVTTIEANAFYGCTKLENIVIPSSVKTIGSNAFTGCENLEKITIKAPGTDVTNAFQNCKNTCIELLYNNIETIDANTTHTSFKSAPKLSIVIDNTCKNIGNNAFNGYSNFSTVTIPDSVTSIGVGAFYNCSSLTSITIPNSVTSIGEYAFYNCSSLTKISLPSKISSIANCTFAYCNKLSNVEIKTGVRTIGDSAFYGCESIMEIDIPEGVEVINGNAFRNCGMTSVTLPSTITEIGANALLYDNTTIEFTIYIKATTPPSVYYSYAAYEPSTYFYRREYRLNGYYRYNSVDVYVPREAIDLYKSYSYDPEYMGTCHPNNWSKYSPQPYDF